LPAQQEPAPEVTASTPAHAEKTVLAKLGLVESASAALAPVAAPPPPEVKIVPEAKLSPAAEVKALPEAKLSPAPEVKAVPEAKPAPVAVAKAAPEAKPIAPLETKPLRDEPRVMEIKPREEKAEEKQVFASLGLPAAAVDTPSLAATQPVAKSVSEFKQSPAEPEISGADHANPIDPIQMTNVPMSSPLRIRALTRADIPAADKLASLAPASDARKLPPEEQRVAYDAPVVIDEPTSIGRRRWNEEAAKYQGLGSPEALLEALKHMGAGAKTLGLPASLWCADFMNLVLRKSGLDATGSRAALSYLKYGRKIDEPRVGAIAVFSRGSHSGHIGIVRGTDGNGNPIIVSGNHNHKVAEAVYPKSRVLAYVVPK